MFSRPRKRIGPSATASRNSLEAMRCHDHWRRMGMTGTRHEKPAGPHIPPGTLLTQNSNFPQADQPARRLDKGDRV